MNSLLFSPTIQKGTKYKMQRQKQKKISATEENCLVCDFKKLKALASLL
jgi:hypothetical protein